jgi:hypothetical protein
MHQRENRLLGGSPWKRYGRIGWDRLACLADTDECGLWVPSATELWHTPTRTSTVLVWRLRGRTVPRQSRGFTSLN